MKIIRSVPSHQSLLRNNRSVLALTVSLLLSGCATFSPDRGMGVVADIADHDLERFYNRIAERRITACGYGPIASVCTAAEARGASVRVSSPSCRANETISSTNSS